MGGKKEKFLSLVKVENAAGRTVDYIYVTLDT